MKHHLISLSALLLLVGCSADPDGDGLSNRIEKDLGSDPEVADTDGDGLSDGEEYELGSDPTALDSDGDGYSDFDEVTEGFDPTDDDDRIYIGGWPYNPNKDDLGNPDIEDYARAGDQVARYVAMDQHGDMVDLYDFAGQSGKPVMVDVSARNCPPCQLMADWLGGDDGAGSQMGIPSSWDIIREAVEDEELYWVTIIYADYQSYNPTDYEGALDWVDKHPHDKVPVLWAEDKSFKDHVKVPFAPSLYLFDEDMVMLSKPSNDTWAPPMLEVITMLED